MDKAHKTFLACFFSALFALAAFWGCSTGVERSPEPGVLRVTIQSNQQDTFIVIKNDTFSVISTDSFGVKFFQGRIFNDNEYAWMYKTLQSYTTEDQLFNVIKRESNQYKKIQIYESYVPPKNYDKLQVGINAEQIRVSRVYIRYLYDDQGNVIGSRLDTTSIVTPVRLPEGASSMMTFSQEFEVKENQITEIVLQISPFASLQRFKDSYLFDRHIEVKEVKYH